MSEPAEEPVPVEEPAPEPEPTEGEEPAPEPEPPTVAEQALISHLANICIPCAENCGSKLSTQAQAVHGMIGAKTRHFYNRLLELPDARCLEVGVWKGAASAALMDGNAAHITFVDNWSEFGRVRRHFMSTLAAFRGDNTTALVEANVFNLDPASLPHRPYNVYVYDARHGEQDHYNALARMLPALADTFIYVCDDWNWSEVRQGTARAIADLGLMILGQHEKRLTQDNNHTRPSVGASCWWNGSWSAVLRKPPAPAPASTTSLSPEEEEEPAPEPTEGEEPAPEPTEGEEPAPEPAPAEEPPVEEPPV